jgi:hypothetical protein
VGNLSLEATCALNHVDIICEYKIGKCGMNMSLGKKIVIVND